MQLLIYTYKQQKNIVTISKKAETQQLILNTDMWSTVQIKIHKN